jgi:hypothetical protein
MFHCLKDAVNVSMFVENAHLTKVTLQNWRIMCEPNLGHVRFWPTGDDLPTAQRPGLNPKTTDYSGFDGGFVSLPCSWHGSC